MDDSDNLFGLDSIDIVKNEKEKVFYELEKEMSPSLKILLDGLDNSVFFDIYGDVINEKVDEN
ncbi:MAG: hypothetical protein MJZ28_00905 [Paludibacteraceae bacterium]|nr:hypothetical protein [Paludibacteraceae bacterium]